MAAKDRFSQRQQQDQLEPRKAGAGQGTGSSEAGSLQPAQKSQQAEGPWPGGRIVSSMLMLEYKESQVLELGGEPALVLRSCAEVVKCGRWEAAGLAFHQAALRFLLAQAGGGTHSLDDAEEAEAEKGASPSQKPGSGAVDPGAWESSRRGKKAGAKGGEEGEQQQDHYALLGLAHLRYLATEDQIRKSYRDAALKFHPDKQAAMLLEEPTEEAREAKKQEIETRFKGIQLAYEVLMDPTKRRVFDSTDEFDDDIPGDCSPESFFQIYGPAFQRNAKWSLVVPGGGVPLLGEDGSSMEDVDKFYDFWWSFKSWREFPSEDEFDLESAESREHKRWMERQNSKMREKAKKEENVRIRQLVENAWKRDPRIARRKEEEKKEKQRRKEEKNRERVQKEEEERRAAEEERVRKEEEEKRAAEEAAVKRKEKEKEKKLVRKERARLRTLAAPFTVQGAAAATAVPFSPSHPSGGAVVSEDEIERLCMSLEMDKLKALCDRIEESTEACAKGAALRLWLRGLDENAWQGNIPDVSQDSTNGPGQARPPISNGPVTMNGHAPQAHSPGGGGAAGGSKSPGDGTVKGKGGEGEEKRSPGVGSRGVKPQQQQEEAARPWSKQEVELLRKAVNKFPKGTQQRWEVIAGYLKSGRTAEEVVKAVKTVLLQKPDDTSAFDSFLQKRKSPQNIASPLSAREEDAAPGQSAGAAEAQVSSGQQGGRAAAGGVGGQPGARRAGTGATAGAGGQVVSGAVGQPGGLTASGKAPGEPGAGTTGAGSDPSSKEGAAKSTSANGDVSTAAADGAAAVDPWSEVQEVALVKALKAFPKDTDKRWERIAAAVPGKNKGQCFKKFQELRQNFRNKKAGASAGASLE